ncbi:MAG: urease accessory protein UreD [Betaproteobacteria bacterium]|nr:urease accessory protein UreD [Betaproteobacteria bacterium]
MDSSSAALARAAETGPQAWHARLTLACARRAGRSALVARAHEGPLAVQKPLYPEGPEVCHVIVVHPPGGIAGGDRLDIDIALEARARMLVTTPGAAKWYKANGREAAQRVRLRLGPGGLLEWLPQETILFDAARARIETEIELAQESCYLGWEICCFGRVASGERFGLGHLRQVTAIRADGRLIWNERSRLDAADRLFGSALGLAGLPVAGTLVAAGRLPDAAVLDRCRAIAARFCEGASRAAVSLLPEVFVARYLGTSGEHCRALFSALWVELRPGLAGRPATPPRIWST